MRAANESGFDLSNSTCKRERLHAGQKRPGHVSCWPLATEIDVRFHVSDRGMSGPVALNVSLVAVDPEADIERRSAELAPDALMTMMCRDWDRRPPGPC